MTRRSHPIYDDWVVWIALLPGVLTLSALGISLAMAWHNHAAWHAVRVSTIPEHDDGYVQGLVKLGATNTRASASAGRRAHASLACGQIAVKCGRNQNPSSAAH